MVYHTSRWKDEFESEQRDIWDICFVFFECVVPEMDGGQRERKDFVVVVFAGAWCWWFYWEGVQRRGGEGCNGGGGFWWETNQNDSVLGASLGNLTWCGTLGKPSPYINLRYSRQLLLGTVCLNKLLAVENLKRSSQISCLAYAYELFVWNCGCRPQLWFLQTFLSVFLVHKFLLFHILISFLSFFLWYSLYSLCKQQQLPKL